MQNIIIITIKRVTNLYYFISILFICLAIIRGNSRAFVQTSSSASASPLLELLDSRQVGGAATQPAIVRTQWISRHRNQSVVSQASPVMISTGSSVELSLPTRTARRAPKAAPVSFGYHPSSMDASVVQQQQLQASNSNDLKLFTLANICERDFMLISIKTSRPFYGVIHTRNERHKPICSIEGNGQSEFNLNISHALQVNDANYCGVFKTRQRSPSDLSGRGPALEEFLSVILAIRMHRNIELSSDKFYLLNCTNRCRRPDCSSPANSTATNDTFGRLINEYEGPEEQETGKCSIGSMPWLVVLLCLLSLLLLASIVSHCFLCRWLIKQRHQLKADEKRKARRERHERALNGQLDGNDDDDDDDDDRLFHLEPQQNIERHQKTNKRNNNNNNNNNYINYDNDQKKYKRSNTLVALPHQQTESKRISSKRKQTSSK